MIDARSIFCSYVCDRCEAKVRTRYRADVFTDAHYWTIEDVEPD